MTSAKPLLDVQDLRVTFNIRREGDLPWTKPHLLHAVGGVDFTLNPGETLGVVGKIRVRQVDAGARADRARARDGHGALAERHQSDRPRPGRC